MKNIQEKRKICGKRVHARKKSAENKLICRRRVLKVKWRDGRGRVMGGSVSVRGGGGTGKRWGET